MTPFTIREVTSSDAEAIHDFNMRWAAEYPNLDTPIQIQHVPSIEKIKDQIHDTLRSDVATQFIAVADDVVIGIVLVHPGQFGDADRHAVGISTYIDKHWRGEGVGKALMQQLLEWATTHPIIERVSLQVYETNTPAIRLYEQFGFAHEGRMRRAYYQRGRYIDMLIMALLFEPKR
mgnify:CR=1 FL=1